MQDWSVHCWKTRQWYIANFARSRAGRSPRPSFLQFGRAKAVPLATPAKYLLVIGECELSTLLHTCYIVAWQTYRQTEYNTSLPLAGEVITRWGLWVRRWIHRRTFNTLVGNLQVLAGTWTRISELMFIRSHITPWSTFTPVHENSHLFRSVSSLRTFPQEEEEKEEVLFLPNKSNNVCNYSK